MPMTSACDGRSLSPRILVALLLSLALHLGVLLLNFGWQTSGGKEAGLSSLQITLLQPEKNERLMAAQGTVSHADGTHLQSPEKESEPVVRLETPRKQRNVKPKSAEKTREPELATPLLPEKVTPDQTSPNDRNQPAIGSPLPGIVGKVKRAEIGFEVFSGEERRLIGTGQHIYVSDSDEQFGISIKQELVAVEARSENQWHIEISGEIGRRGLSPFLYESQGDLSRRLLAIKNVADKVSASAGGNRKWRMPDGIIDRQSLLYYFMSKPPELTGGQVRLSDGVSHDLYAYHISGTDSFFIAPFGEVHAIKLMFTASESSETIELWLVPDLHYLPVKVRHIDKQGLVTEQMATSLNFK